MAGKAMKRSASSGAKKVAKKCKVIEATIKQSESLPQPVRSIISNRLAHVFGTYKEDRHDFQKTCSKLVGDTLKGNQKDLEKAIADAEASKGQAAAAGATLGAANLQAATASDGAAQGAADAKAAWENAQTELKDAKQHLADCQEAVKTLASDTADGATKKEKLESLIKEFFVAVKEGTLDKGLSKSAAYAGKYLGREFGDALESEFLTCVVRSYSKAASAWGTFDHIVATELTKELDTILKKVGAEHDGLVGQKDGTAANVETAKAGVEAAKAKVETAKGASHEADAAAKTAKAAAKTAADEMKIGQKAIDKADGVLEDAKGKLEEFKTGPLAAYNEVVDHTAPPPPPEPPAQTASLEEAMQAAPAPSQSGGGYLASPVVMAQRAAQGLSRAAAAVGLAPSPRVSASPRVMSSPGAAS